MVLGDEVLVSGGDESYSDALRAGSVPPGLPGFATTAVRARRPEKNAQRLSELVETLGATFGTVEADAQTLCATFGSVEADARTPCATFGTAERLAETRTVEHASDRDKNAHRKPWYTPGRHDQDLAPRPVALSWVPLRRLRRWYAGVDDADRHQRPSEDAAR
jgi:hypothetical protein